MKIVLPFFDEIRYLGSPITENGIVCFSNLKKEIRLAKKLLKTYNECSKIYLVLESEAIMIKFHTVYEKLFQALGEMPFDELVVSVEVREQVRKYSSFLSLKDYFESKTVLDAFSHLSLTTKKVQKLNALSQEGPKLFPRSQSLRSLQEQLISDNLQPISKNTSQIAQDLDAQRVKVTYGDEKIRFRMHSKWRFKDLLHEITRRMNIDDISRFDFKYL